MPSFTRKTNKYFTKQRIIRMISFLSILVAFLLVYGSNQQQQQLQQLVHAQQSDYQIYGKNTGPGDWLASGWTIGSGQSTHSCDPSSKQFSYTEPNAISYAPQAGAHDVCPIVTSTPVDISAYSYLVFYARATQPLQTYGITLLGTDGSTHTGNQVNVTDYGGPIPTDKFAVYNIPLSNFGASTTPIGGIEIADTTGSSLPPVYIDEISLKANQGTVDPNAVGSAGTPMPTPSHAPDYYPQISPWVFIVPAIVLFLAMFL